MPKKKTPVRSPWTKDDIRQLKAYSKARTPVVEVAKAMKRTEAAVRQKAKTILTGQLNEAVVITRSTPGRSASTL
jgi:hypothetical protein